ncbi:TetR family transcriptional regulator C-terminal domain-containing protein [Notoacmeibacter sp. MSK16QG-6]|uniref:TetR family transcriptional regulator C-terminal domain-containing protein n=1 Tax=Notoacmeibacter sp. MSK16QG-6 TaxID=2957982 RepID=UPI00209E9332|nr:TetR family transcriptional regulator C-terminal domain-containing protein [Notoacmeibacter sp. MSK16QG-6]MCP1198700.1 TetR family transcriptional regulator C-terminal domain-containing protein [Notoacmeibacter sp. MSK16QG-6]
MSTISDQSSNDPEGRSRIQSRNRETILTAGREVFARHGLRGARLDEIAAHAGMSKPNLLYYFPRKQDIYAAVLEEVLMGWLMPLDALDPDGDPVEELRRYISAKMALSAEQPEASRLFAGEILAGAPHIERFLKTDLRQLVEKKAGTIRRWVDEGRLAPIDPYHLIFTIWATTQHYADFDVQIHAVLGKQAGRAGFHDQAAQAVLSIILKGVAPR